MGSDPHSVGSDPHSLGSDPDKCVEAAFVRDVWGFAGAQDFVRGQAR